MITVDGKPVGPLPPPGLNTYGHYSAMQVRARKVRGIALHLTRLREATAELFDQTLDDARVRRYLRDALRDTPDASANVYVYAGPTVIVAVQPPAPTPSPRRLRSVPYQRPVAHLKHLGSFAQVYHGRQAVRDGFDDALLTGPGGVVSEAAIANIGFFADGADVVWPDAPQLPGITMQLIEPRLESRRKPVHLADLRNYAGAFVTNSHGVAPVTQIDEVRLPVPADRMKALVAAYDSVPWDDI